MYTKIEGHTATNKHVSPIEYGETIPINYTAQISYTNVQRNHL